MPNIAAVLREEITRLARKEIKSQTESLRKASAAYRRHIADLKRRVEELEREASKRQMPKDEPSQVSEADAVRFSAKGLRSNRKRLGLTAADYGKLIGVTAQTVYSWEQAHTRPRKQHTAASAAVRTMGKKAAQARLAELGDGGKGS